MRTVPRSLCFQNAKGSGIHSSGYTTQVTTSSFHLGVTLEAHLAAFRAAQVLLDPAFCFGTKATSKSPGSWDMNVSTRRCGLDGYTSRIKKQSIENFKQSLNKESRGPMTRKN